MSIQFIAAILITIVGITLALGSGLRYMSSDNVYCDTYYKVKGGLWANKRDVNCAQNVRLGILSIEMLQEQQKLFASNVPEMSFDFREADSYTFDFSVPGGSLITEAVIGIELQKAKIQNFSTPNVNNVPSDILNFPREGGERTMTVRVPKDAHITNAKMRLTGVDIPGMADIVFIIDTSGSMTDEWASVCTAIGEVAEAVSETTDLVVWVYSLADNGKNCPLIDGIQMHNADLDQNLLGRYWGEWCIGGNPDCVFVNIPEYVEDMVPHDLYKEAWGIGTYYIIRQRPGLRDNSKIILVPVSDSDPTGGGALDDYLLITDSWQGIGPWGPEGIFRGTEQRVIDMIRGDPPTITGVLTPYDYIFPVYGNLVNRNKPEPDPYEGYEVGYSRADCFASHPRCAQVLTWMDQLADASGGTVSGYTDTALLIQAVQTAINTSYPEDLRGDIDGFEFFFHADELNRTNSPIFAEFWKQLDLALDVCIPDGNGWCDLEITFYSSNEGSLAIDSLIIEYVLPIDEVTVRLNGVDFRAGPIGVDDEVFVDFTDLLRRMINETCDVRECPVELSIRTTNYESLLKVTDLSVDYDLYLLEETLVSRIFDCWDKASRGQSRKDILCEEFVVPHDYKFIEPITEARLTSIILDRNSCHIIPNEPHGCGRGDTFDMTKDINSVTNILIEYDTDAKRIIVS
ncbi:MAG: hypothetical protein ABIC95_06370 [archaeon]